MVLASQKARPVYKVYQFLWTAVDWIYPPICGGCEEVGYRWCPECAALTPIYSGPICPRCGEFQEDSDLCFSCRTNPPAFERLRSCAIYTGRIRHALHRLKYMRDIGLADVLAGYLVEQLRSLQWPIDMITAVPTSKKRLRERGYNQAAMLAFPLAIASRKPYAAEAIRKVRETESQVGLNAEQRRQNVEGVFQASEKIVKGENILLIDDIKTTGSTMQACTLALYDAGAASVFCMTLARAIIGQDAPEMDIIGTEPSETPDVKSLF